MRLEIYYTGRLDSFQEDNMLFIIKNCHPERYRSEMDKLCAISNILKSHGERKNIVLAQKETLYEIINSDIYGVLEKRYAEDILQNSRELGSLKDHLEIHAVIDFSIKNHKHHERNSITLGYDFFIDPEKINHPSFIAEDESDYNFYKMIADIHQKHNSKLNLGVNFNFCLGAGSQCKPQFDRLKSEDKIVLCIVDNDKPHPKKSEGSTAAAFKTDERGQKDCYFLEILKHREIEGLIPLKVIEKIVTEKIKEKIDALDEIKEMLEINPETITYFDLKDGITLEDMINLDNAHGEFWTKTASKISKFNSKSCLKDRTPKNCDNCNLCPKISGLSNNLLDLALEIIKNESSHTTYKNIESNLKQEWNRLGHLISSWGCHLKHKTSRS